MKARKPTTAQVAKELEVIARSRLIATTAIRLEELRHEHSLSLEAMAEKVGVSRPAYEHWKNGRRTPGGEHIRAIAMAFGVTAGWVLAIPGEPKYRGRTKS